MTEHIIYILFEEHITHVFGLHFVKIFILQVITNHEKCP